MIHIRTVELKDRAEWARMRKKHYSHSQMDHQNYIDSFFVEGDIPITEVFVAEKNEGELCGFLELFIHSYNEKKTIRQIPHIESWYVDEDPNKEIIRASLLQAAEDWLKSKKFFELASQVEISNTEAIDIHRSSGFKEIERTICFIKKIG